MIGLFLWAERAQRYILLANNEPELNVKSWTMKKAQGLPCAFFKNPEITGSLRMPFGNLSMGFTHRYFLIHAPRTLHPTPAFFKKWLFFCHTALLDVLATACLASSEGSTPTCVIPSTRSALRASRCLDSLSRPGLGCYRSIPAVAFAFT